jgi:hypothetical protein
MIPSSRVLRLKGIAVVAAFWAAPALALAAPPPNDALANATVVTALPFTQQESTVDATGDPSGPSPSCAPGSTGKSVWYRFMPSFSGQVRASTIGSSYDTVLAAFTTGPVTERACNDDTPTEYQSEFSLNVTSGTTYYLMVTAFGGDGGDLHFSLTSLSVAPLTVSIGDASQVEGHAGMTLLAFPVTLSAASTAPVSVNYGTASGTASAGGDYTPTSGILTLAAGQTTRTLLVPVVSDTLVESDETVLMNLSNPVGVALARTQATGTIVDDDPSVEAVLITQFRLYSPVTLEHHYTTDAYEYTVLGPNGWLQEGASYAMFFGPGTYQGVQAVPVFRLYHSGILQHFWTTDWFEVTVLVGGGTWTYEGIPGYVLPSQTPDTIPVYRLVLPNPPLHLWTTDAYERQVLTTERGWQAEGVLGYVPSAQSVNTAAGITDANGNVLLAIHGQLLPFQLSDANGDPAPGLAVGMTLDPSVPGVGLMAISHPQDTFLPKFRLIVHSGTAGAGSDRQGAGTLNTVATVYVQLAGVLDDSVNTLRVRNLPDFPVLDKVVKYSGAQFLAVLPNLAQSMNTITGGRVGSTLVGWGIATETTLTIEEALAELQSENLTTGVKGAILLGLGALPPTWPAAALEVTCGAVLDLASTALTQNALLRCARVGSVSHVTKVTVAGKSIYACGEPPTIEDQVAGLVSFPASDPQSGGLLQLISKGSFGLSYAGVVSGDNTVGYSVPPGVYDAVVIPPLGSPHVSRTLPVNVPSAGGPVEVRECTSAENQAHDTVCASQYDAAIAICDGISDLVAQAECVNAAISAWLTCRSSPCYP